MLITSILSIIYSVLALVHHVYGTFVFHLLTRWVCSWWFICLPRLFFPFYHFGKAYGLTMFLAGILLFSQFGLYQIVLYLDPSFKYINLGFLVLCILTLVHPLAILFQLIRS